MQGVTKCAVKGAHFVACDKLCRGDKMCRNKPAKDWLLLTLIPSTSRHIMNNKADTGHPCLIPLDILKVSEICPLFLIHASGFQAVYCFYPFYKSRSKIKILQ